MDIIQAHYGALAGREVTLYTLSNDRGMEVDITNYGGIITAIRIPDKDNGRGDVVLGFDSLDHYTGDHPYLGAIIGRVANRIAGGKFELGGREFRLAVNNGPNHLHGGLEGFDKKVWTAATKKDSDQVSLKLGYESRDMEEGYPGNLMVEVIYSLSNNNDLAITYRASTDAITHVNLTNHSYFNLNNGKGTVHDHEVMIDADRVTEQNEDQIPTGRYAEVRGTPFDFRRPKLLGKGLSEVSPGYDINYVINDYTGDLKKIAAVHHAGTGRTMEVFSTQPGVQFYTANYVDQLQGKGGIMYGKHSALCLETQHFPDTPNQDAFPSTLLHPGDTYEQVTIYRFNW
jgi:aldose 1-epimerase